MGRKWEVCKVEQVKDYGDHWEVTAVIQKRLWWSGPVWEQCGWLEVSDSRNSEDRVNRFHM